MNIYSVKPWTKQCTKCTYGTMVFDDAKGKWVCQCPRKEEEK